MNNDTKSWGTLIAGVELPKRSTLCDNCAKKDVCKYSETLYDLTIKSDALAKFTNINFISLDIKCLRFLKIENHFD
jgi:hypothetical protein